MAATISDVAKRANVSVGTVTRVFHRNPTVKESLVARVNQAARELGYVAKQASREDTIAILIEEQTKHSLGGYLSTLFEEIVAQAHKRNMRMDVFIAKDIPLLRSGFLAGAVSLLWKRESLETLAAFSNIPLVTVNEEIEGISSVCMNEVQGIEKAMNYFLKCGHQRIGFLALDDGANYSRVQRQLAFDAFIKKHKLPVFKDQIQIVDTPPALAYHLNRLMFIGKPTAVLLIGEDTGIQVMRNLSILGIRVPDDVSLVGFDFQYVSEYFSPPQTCLAQDPEALTEAAFSIVTQIAQESGTGKKKKRSKATRKYIDYKWFERDSVSQVQK